MNESEFGSSYRLAHPYIAVGICSVGIVMNIIFVVILLQRPMRTVTNMLLVTIACSDILLMISYLIYSAYQLHKSDCRQQSYNWAVFLLVHAGGSVTLYGISTWLTICMAILRHRIVTSAHVFRLQPVTVLHIVIPVVLGVILASTPIYIGQNVRYHPRQPKGCNGTLYTVGPSQFAKRHDRIPITVAYWSTAILFKLLPCILLTVFVLLLIFHIAKKKERSMSLRQPASKLSISMTQMAPGSNSDRLLGTMVTSALAKSATLAIKSAGSNSIATERLLVKSSAARANERVNKILLCILIVFLICQLPQVVINLMGAIMGPKFSSGLYRQIGPLMDDLSLISSCVNFCLYCSMSTQFRNILYETFVKKQLDRSREFSNSTQRAKPSITH